MNEWVKYECEECNRHFIVEQISGDELEEPACPECGGTNCKEMTAHAVGVQL